MLEHEKHHSLWITLCYYQLCDRLGNRTGQTVWRLAGFGQSLVNYFNLKPQRAAAVISLAPKAGSPTGGGSY